jgi:phosphoglycerol transferase
VRLHFREPLPKKLNLFLTMQAFGPNVGKEFVVRVGQMEKRVKLAPLPHEVFLQFETDGMQKTVTIDVPQAVSPQELGMSADIRRLGLGMWKVELGMPAR